MLSHSAFLAFVVCAVGASAAFVGCSPAQITALDAAIPVAQTYAAAALDQINADPTGSMPGYAAWFGAPSIARRNLVLQHFALVNGNNFQNYIYDCTGAGARCTPNVAAYVDANTFGTVNLCAPYWTLPPDSRETFQSQASTIVHEATHFAANGETRDYKRTVGDCQILALTRPDQAVMNAASHEYFAVQSALV
ncbi:Peptidyl-Lys metalloendopeptidase [Grifola frondosa]|uniref:Peptidyl-Lys metalloendopeptidase n=1 Tax=Grifola frondosa TaxID=5627 RepID=A0A1C7M8Z3_GRIFR|nr:Peptidyl-Lys metalloendopeptidase [Grifola frondosa]